MSRSGQKETSNQNDIPQLSADTNEVESLTQVADCVWELVKVHKHKARFLEQAQKFQAQSDRVSELLTGYIQQAEADPTLKQYNDGCAPHDGLEWDNYFRIWRPPLPFEPWDWLSYHYANTFPPKFSELQFKPPEPNPGEYLMCEYVLLGIIRDEELDLPLCDRLCSVLNSEL